MLLLLTKAGHIHCASLDARELLHTLRVSNPDNRVKAVGTRLDLLHGEPAAIT